jgi:hypothetical protein
MRLAAWSAAISLGGCSTTATIHRANGPAYEAKILRSDPTSLDVQGDDERPYRVPCEQVSEIDHPGNVIATVGAALMGIAGLAAWSIATERSQADRRDGVIAVSIGYGLPGLLMAVYGGSVWYSSKNKARACEEAPMPVVATPPDRPAYPPPWAAPTWSPVAPTSPVPKPPIRREAEPMPPPTEPPVAPQSDSPSFRPAPPAPESEPAPAQ